MKVALIISAVFLFLIIIGQCSGPDDSQSSSPEEGTPIPRSMAGDKGRYFLLEAKRDGNIVKALHKRIGVNSVDYTRTEVNCAKGLMREIGYSEESPAATPDDPTKWFALVPGSSKSDLAIFVCQHY